MTTFTPTTNASNPEDAAAIAAADAWLAYSGCTLHDGPYAGGVRHYYDWRARAWGDLYNEITGYAVSLWVRLYAYTGEDLYMRLAEQSAAYLRSVQVKDAPNRGAVPTGINPLTGATVTDCYSFDVAMVVAGWCDLYQVTGDRQWKECIERGVTWLLTMQSPEGSFRAGAHLAGESLGGQLGFAGDGGCLHGKHTIALLKAAEACDQPGWQTNAVKVADHTLGLQSEDGAFWANTERSFVFTHAHCYAVEGLLVAASRLGRADYHTAAVRGARWLTVAQLPDGSLARFYKVRRPGRALLERWYPIRALDATAQATRIWSVLAKEDTAQFQECADRAWSFLTAHQWREHVDPAARGAFPYQLRGQWTSPHINTWVNQFALSAAWMQRPGREVSVDDLF